MVKRAIGDYSGGSTLADTIRARAISIDGILRVEAFHLLFNGGYVVFDVNVGMNCPLALWIVPELRETDGDGFSCFVCSR
jgi:hypothetical protein